MKSPSLQIGSFTFNWGSRTYVMGILNVTPDSFSGDGIISKGDALDIAVEQARGFLASGADILDVGGESTRPGSAPVNADEEIERVVPIIRALHKKFPQAIISIDTYKAEVAEEAIKAGATTPRPARPMGAGHPSPYSAPAGAATGAGRRRARQALLAAHSAATPAAASPTP